MVRTPIAIACWMLLAFAGCRQPLQVSAGVRVIPELNLPGTAEAVQPQAVPSGDDAGGGPAVAVIDVDGLMVNTDFTGIGSAGENPVALFRERLDAADCNQCICGVVVRINSHGGGVTASDIMWHDLVAFKQRTGLPVVACLMDVGAGGAYYLATAADQIVAHPTSVTGGIGVILNVYNLQDALQQFNISAVPVRAGGNIDLGSPIKTMDDKQRKLLQTMANEFQSRFRDVVHESRPNVDMNDATNFDGRVFTATQARDRNLIDHVGYLDDAVAMAGHMAHVQNPRVVLLHRPNDKAHSEYSVTPNIPLGASLVPLSLPGYDRSRLPGFLYMWQPEPTMEKLSGK